MTAKTAKDLLTHGSIEENFLSEYFVGKATSADAVPEDVAYIGDGIETIDVTQEDKKNSKSYYNGGGQETTTVTGSTRSLALSGDRSTGDPAQDLLAALADQTGAARNVWLRELDYVQSDDGKSLELTKVRTGIATVSDITDKGGNATDPGAFKATLTYAAKPTVLDAATDADKMTSVLTETPSINAEILGETAVVKGAAPAPAG
ncbi:phage tail tube protein [Lacticaseibacillus parakribbianus]|uniref:phage tail tube protein n=1 Tax=Lacticaseibacillus parakribbianus TaxID=2970927 RepID=UPI0021CB234C|nr:hypothetical protein [Lacticaseibacillus parakribbianus]